MTPQTTPTKIFSVRLPTALILAFKHKALDEAKYIQDIVHDLITNYLDEELPPKPPEGVRS